MICVSLQEATTDAVLARMSAAARHADLFEIRLDGLAAPDVTRLFRRRRQRLIATCRPEAEGGRWQGSEVARLALLRAAAHAGADFIDIERGRAAELGRPPGARVILSVHDYQGMPDDLPGLARRMARSDADVLKLAVTPHGVADVRKLLALPGRCARPMIALGMGPAAAPTRVLQTACGGAWTYAAAVAGGETAPGQRTAQELCETFRYRRITADTRVFGVIGDPVAHSLSPWVFNRLFARRGFDAVYLPLLCRDRADVQAALSWPAVHGLSVTLPHKECVLDRVGAAAPEARAIGAANTLYRATAAIRSRWRAANTDAPAIAASLQRLMRAAGRRELRQVRTLVVGAGGAARAVVFAAQALGCDCTVTSRTDVRARALARSFGAAFAPWRTLRGLRPDLLINATPVGMAPAVDALPVPLALLRAGTMVFDLIYTPLETRLLAEARRRGAHVLGGAEMFVEQAARQAEHWLGAPISRRPLRTDLLRALAARAGEA